jgi:hypothetical protein
MKLSEIRKTTLDDDNYRLEIDLHDGCNPELIVGTIVLVEYCDKYYIQFEIDNPHGEISLSNIGEIATIRDAINLLYIEAKEK